MTDQHRFAYADHFDHDLYTRTRTRDRVLNAAIVRADFGESTVLDVTSVDARRSGLYVSECCGKELAFGKGETFWRCPRAHSSSRIEFADGLQNPFQF